MEGRAHRENPRGSSGTFPTAAPEDGALVLNLVQSSGANQDGEKQLGKGHGQVKFLALNVMAPLLQRSCIRALV